MKTVTKRKFDLKKVEVISKTSHRLSAKEVEIMKSFFNKPIYIVKDCLSEKESQALFNLEELCLIHEIEDSFKPEYELAPEVSLDDLKALLGV